MSWWKFDIRVCFLSYRIKVVIKTILIAVGSVMVLLLKLIKLVIVVAMFSIEIIVLIPFKVFLMLFQLFSKYFS